MSARIVTWEPGAPSVGPTVVAIGVFDGVHLGHQALLAAAVRDAHERGVPCSALTFDRDPDQVVTPDVPSAQLLSLADKCRYLAEAGADIVVVIPFDTEIASMPPGRFVSDVLLTACRPLAVHVGEDFRFGHFAEGTVESLETLGADAGFEVATHELVRADHAPVTSTRIRALVARGSLADASFLLGRAHRISGMVVKGRGEGRALLGIPTANLLPSEHAALPASGVYAGRVFRSDGTDWPAAVSVGKAPTFPEAHDVLEAHLIGFSGDLLHEELVIEFTQRLRDQRAFHSMQELASAMREDFDRVSTLFGEATL